MANACREVKDGLSQILFVIQGKITDEEWEVYNLLRSTIFDGEITNYTTIVRTNFSDFEEEKECEEDKRDLEKESQKLAELVRTCNGFIYVDNPPLKYKELAKEKREKSRSILLKHLIYDCGNYRPVSLDRLNERISSYMTEKEQLEKKLADLESARQEEKIRTEEERIRNREEQQKAQEKMAELQAQIEIQVQEQIKWKEKFNKLPNFCRPS